MLDLLNKVLIQEFDFQFNRPEGRLGYVSFLDQWHRCSSNLEEVVNAFLLNGFSMRETRYAACSIVIGCRVEQHPQEKQQQGFRRRFMLRIAS